jgi:hypothetical protein
MYKNFEKPFSNKKNVVHLQFFDTIVSAKVNIFAAPASSSPMAGTGDIAACC